MSEILSWLASQWAERIGPALSAMTGVAACAEVSAEGREPDPGAELEAWRQPILAGQDACLWVAASPGMWLAAGREVLRAAGIGFADDAEARSAFLEVLQQSLGQLTGPLSERIGHEIEVPKGEFSNERPAAQEWALVEIKVGETSLGSAWVALSPALEAALAADAQSARETCEAGPGAAQPAEESLPAAPNASEPERTAGRRGRPSRTLDLLMEVDLPVGVTFGRAQMRLKDVIKLTSGSIVELNRTIAEPVEIIVNNCVIARGEVVVVEGNYGVRIQEIISREERLRTLF